MPVQYGQVEGMRFDNLQTLHDPGNPKKSRYQPKIRVVRSVPAAPKPRALRHGASVYRDGRCSCDVCKEAWERKKEKDRETKRKRSEAEHMNADRTMAKCSRCGKWKPVGRFPNIGENKCNKWVCVDCKNKLEVPLAWKR